MTQKNPETLAALFEELIERGALELALANRSESELVKLLEGLSWKVSDYRYQGIYMEVLRVTIDMYSGVIGLSKKVDAVLFSEIMEKLGKDTEVSG